MFALHETCLEYFRRRLSEGWKEVCRYGNTVFISPPEGNLIRAVNLTGDIETLRPNAGGDKTELKWAIEEVGHAPDVDENWKMVDEEVPDELTTTVFSTTVIFRGDLYNLPAPTGSGIINKVTLYFRVRSRGPLNVVRGAIKSDAIVTETADKNPYVDFGDGVWGTYSQEWATNPADGEAWEWADIDALQIGISLNRLSYMYPWCTQVYVEVDYTPSLTTNAATGINPISAILNGTLDEDFGEVWDVRFQWGRTGDYGNDTPWQAGFSEGDTFSQLINTLEPGTLYHFRAQAKNSLGTVSGQDVAFWTLKPSVGKAYAFSRELHIKRPIDVVDKASIAASGITTLADCKGLNLIEVPSSLTLTVEATYHAAATQGIKVHVRTSLTGHALGTHTGADGAAALTDAEAHFVDDELVGLTIKNLTDGSSGAITANTGTGVTATLVGGTDNDWDSGDAYIIEGAGYDTENWDSFTPAFGAGSSIRQTEHYDVDPVYLKVLVENLDGSEAVTDVKIIMAVGT